MILHGGIAMVTHPIHHINHGDDRSRRRRQGSQASGLFPLSLSLPTAATSDNTSAAAAAAASVVRVYIYSFDDHRPSERAAA